MVTREVVRIMKSGSAIVDVAVDQGECIETTRPTSYADDVQCESKLLKNPHP